jgi:hypothetical protein
MKKKEKNMGEGIDARKETKKYRKVPGGTRRQGYRDTEHRGAAFSFGAPKVWTRTDQDAKGPVTFCGSATRALVGPGAHDGGPLRGPYGGLLAGTLDS